MTITPLNNITHKNLKVTQSTDYRRFKDQQLIPVVAQDFALLATEFPIVFVKNSETGKFLPVAMMGIKQGINVYCQSETWSCPAKPLAFTHAPFSLAKTAEDSDELVLCVDTSNPLVNEKDGVPLFDENGEQSEFLKNKSQYLLDMIQFSDLTQSITDFLVSKNLLISKQLTVKVDAEDAPQIIDGIYLVDEKALNELSEEDFQDLRVKGLLPLIYAHLTSIHQISRLTMMHNALSEK